MSSSSAFRTAVVCLLPNVVVRRKVGSDEISTEPKIFNTAYEVVVSRQGSTYTIWDVITGQETTAVPSQIAQMRSPAGPAETEEVELPTQSDGQMYDNGHLARFASFG